MPAMGRVLIIVEIIYEEVLMDLLKRVLLLAGLLIVPLIVFPLPCTAQVSVDVHIGPPPPFRIAAPPSVVVIPGTYVYMVPDIGADIFFCSGNWYRLHQGRWFSAGAYNGPWMFVPGPRVPGVLLQLPPDYRHILPGWRRIPYGELRKNWAGWERNRYWEKDRDWKAGWHGRPEGRPEEGRGRPAGKPGAERGRDVKHGEHGERGH
jgi:hypothetical protein